MAAISAQTANLLVRHALAQSAYRWIPPLTTACGRSPLLEKGNAVSQPTFSEGVLDPASARSWEYHITACDDLRELVSRYGLPPGVLAGKIVNHLQEVDRFQAFLVAWGTGSYPHLLAQVLDPPLILTGRGGQALLRKRTVAIVGARRPSRWAAETSFTLGLELAKRGWAIVSGGAFGCDICAHRGALAAQVVPVPAIVVFAGGLARLYPRALVETFRDLYESGALFLSERWIDAASRPIDFPRRNRIISGLSEMVILMQAARHSGARLTANLALDQGRELLVLQHPADDKRAEGSHSFIDDGAPSFRDIDEALDEVERLSAERG